MTPERKNKLHGRPPLTVKLFPNPAPGQYSYVSEAQADEAFAEAERVCGKWGDHPALSSRNFMDIYCDKLNEIIKRGIK